MVRLTCFRFGPGYYQDAGTLLELSPEDEALLIEAGHAERIDAPPAAERPRKSPPGKPSGQPKAE